MASGFVGSLRDHAKELLRFEKSQAREFLRLLKELRERLAGRLAGVLPSGDEPFNVFTLRRVLAETELGINLLERQSGAFFAKLDERAVELALSHVSSDLNRLSSAFEGQTFRVSLDAAKVLADPERGLLAEQFPKTVRKYGLDVLNQVRGRMFVAMRTGEPNSQIIRELASPKGVLGERPVNDAERLIRTETSQAYGTAQMSAIEQADEEGEGGLMKTWMHTGSYRCPICMPLHGTTRKLRETWTIKSGKTIREVEHAPAHPNCCPPGTRIKTPLGERAIEEIVYGDYVLGGLTGEPRRVIKTHVNRFDGRLFRIITNKVNIAVTANHPVLTERGWIEAEAVNVGDHLFEYVGVSQSLARDSQYTNSPRENIAVSSTINQALSVGVVPTTGSSLKAGQSFVGTELGHFEGSGLRQIPPRQTSFFQSVINSGPAASELFGNQLNSESIFPVKSANFGWVDFNPLHVEKIEQIAHSGQVFNLSVEHDESYNANGAVVHNCVCRVVAMRPSWAKKMKEAGYLEQEFHDPESEPEDL